MTTGDLTCATCPWWTRLSSRPLAGLCHHVSANNIRERFATSWWCSEHPLRQRDRLAEMAMQGLLADPNCDPDPEAVASGAYSYADAMLAERAKNGGRS